MDYVISKRKVNFFFAGGGIFLGPISLKRVFSPQKMVINLLRTYEKLSSKGEPYQLSGYRAPLVHTERQRFILLQII